MLIERELGIILVFIIIILVELTKKRTINVLIPTLKDNFRIIKISDDTGIIFYVCECNIKKIEGDFYLSRWDKITNKSFKSLEDAKDFNENYFLKLTTRKKEIVC